MKPITDMSFVEVRALAESVHGMDLAEIGDVITVLIPGYTPPVNELRELARLDAEMLNQHREWQDRLRS